MERGAPVTTPGGGMTQAEALAEARRRWGVHAEALIEGEWLGQPLYKSTLSSYEIDGLKAGACVICCGHYDYRGRDEDARCEEHWGQGATWGEAVSDADRRAYAAAAIRHLKGSA